jgi:putative DNA primase/helicase
VFTYSIASFDIAPILAILSPVKGCGKTTLVIILRALVWMPQVASNISTSALFRVIDKHHPTLLIDEIDAQLKHGNEELRGILNAGHTRNTAKVIRSVGNGNDYEPREFDVWAPKVLAGIGKLPPTVQDRAVTVAMRRRLPHETIERIRQDRIEGQLEWLRVQTKQWADAHLGQLRDADPVLPDGLSDRACDNWRPLLAIADTVGGEWPARAREAAMLLNQSPALEEDRGTLLLADIRRLFEDNGSEFLRTEQLLSDLNRMDERPWATYTYGHPLTSQGLARLLQPFDIGPKQRRGGQQVIRGYYRIDFREAFARYLGQHSPKPATTATTATDQQIRAAFGGGFSCRREHAYDDLAEARELPDLVGRRLN